MNSLSWMLYWADVAGSVSTVGTTVSVGAAIGGLVAVVGRAIKIDSDNIGSREKQPVWRGGWAIGKGFFLTAIVAAAVVTPVPGKDTIYAIAASEMGESALKSETGGKAVQALNAWLDRQIAGEKSK